MNRRSVSFLLICLAGLTLLSLTSSAQPSASPRRRFTIQDEIGIAHFGDPYTGQLDPILVSPDGRFVAVHTERGLLQADRLEDEVRIYEIDVLRRFVNGDQQTGEPFWTIKKSTYREGVLISDWRWLPDSRALAFRLRGENGWHQVWLAELFHRKLRALTPANQDVTAFDIRDAQHMAYSVRAPEPAAKKMKRGAVAGFFATGLGLVSPLTIAIDDPDTYELWNRNELWAIDGGKPFPLIVRTTGKRIPIYPIGVHCEFSLSPDGKLIAAALPVEEVPKEWETLYLPPSERGSIRIKGGHQDLDAAVAAVYVSAYSIIDLRDGTVSIPIKAPEGWAAGWFAAAQMTWSDDSRSVLLPATFLPDHSGPPCIGLALPSAASVECVEPLKFNREELVWSVKFAPGRADSVVIDYAAGGSRRTRTVARTSDGKWHLERDIAARIASSDIELKVTQSLNQRPILVAIDRSSQTSRTVWDPNPQLLQIDLGNASTYHWTDASGKQRVGGLYKPSDYEPGRRYPLVIQTHGFLENQFRPSGIYPTAFAARALAAAGILVLQAPDCSNSATGTPDEAPCHMREYAGAISHLTVDGVIDPDRVGIVGFSRTCFYVMQALTMTNMHFRAASISQGDNQGYWDYVFLVDQSQGLRQRDSEGVIGAPPFGDGLEQWFKKSPGFQLDKVKAPLLVVPRRGIDTMYMWDSYALLRVLNKPVELLVLNTNQHILTNPGVRIASQGGTVDWFRFWLQDYEDPDPAKKDQYDRWRELRKLQEQNETKHKGIGSPPIH